MGFYETFKAITQVNGVNHREYNLSLAQDSFDEYFENAIDRVDDGFIDGVSYPYVLQHFKYIEDTGDEKELIVENSTPVNVGSLVTFETEKWIVYNEKNRAIKTHQAFKIRLCNSSIKKRKLTDDTVFEEDCVFTFAERFESKDKKIRDWKSARVAIVQSNENTNSIVLNDRFIFNNKRAFKVVDMDETTTNGIITLYLEASQINEELDDLANNIAYNGEASNPIDDDNGVKFTDDENNILNEFEALMGINYDINVYNYVSGTEQSNTFTFVIDGIDSDKYLLTNVTSNSFTIQGLDNVFTGTIKAIDDGDLSEYTIPLTLKGMF